jgi:hypothetical protein
MEERSWHHAANARTDGIFRPGQAGRFDPWATNTDVYLGGLLADGLASAGLGHSCIGYSGSAPDR